MQVAARTYRAWRTRLPALRAIEAAKIIDTLRGLKDLDSEGRPKPEILYGRRKMNAWLRRNGFPEVSKHTVDRPMRDEGMTGLIRGRKTRRTIPGKDGNEPATCSSVTSAPAHPTVFGLPTSPSYRSIPVSCTWLWSSTCFRVPSSAGKPPQ